MSGLNLSGTETMSANGDQWLEFNNDDHPVLVSCNLHAASAGLVSCFDIFPTTESDGIVITSTAAVIDVPITTFHLIVESSAS